MSVASASTDNVLIREVWDDNLTQEFALIREIVDDFPFVAMDTEFPGVVSQPARRTYKSRSDYQYTMLKINVDMLKLIQLGLTFSDERGNLPTCNTGFGCIWQFNFREFDAQTDLCASDSIDLLRQCGIDFKKNSECGVDALRFGELLMSSGVVLNDDVQWITFHGSSDFGYLLKLLICRELPETQVGFYELIKIYFPTLYDIKYVIRYCNNLHGGLSKLAEMLGVRRIGVSHQAGSDSLLTSRIFGKLRETYFRGSTYEKHAGVLFGLDVHDKRPYVAG